MATHPILVRCRHCHKESTLAEIAGERTGVCPWCLRLYVPEWSAVLLEQSRRAEHAQQELLYALRLLTRLPGNLEIVMTSILRNLLEEIDWEPHIAAEPGLTEETIVYMSDRLQEWQRIEEELRKNKRAHHGEGERSLARLLSLVRGALPAHQQPHRTSVSPAPPGESLDSTADDRSDGVSGRANARGAS